MFIVDECGTATQINGAFTIGFNSAAVCSMSSKAKETYSKLSIGSGTDWLSCSGCEATFKMEDIRKLRFLHEGEIVELFTSGLCPKCQRRIALEDKYASD
jgi:hypothetical protein